MSKKYKFHDPSACYFITCTVVDWVDAFTRNNYRQIITDSLTYCQQNKGLIIHGWVLMTNHLHMIISSDGRKLLGDVMRDFKAHTSRAMRLEMTRNDIEESRSVWMMYRFTRNGRENLNNEDFQFWQQGSHPILLNDRDMFRRALHYIHQNPVVAGFVTEPEHWRWGSAVDYAGGKGLLELVLLDV